ncbi:MAG: hypothetical protein ABFR50_00700, partial [Candidatus Fermentibacteria bacterium]
MKSNKDANRAAARLTTTVSAHETPAERIDALAKFISGYKPDEIGRILGSVILDACLQIEAGITFLSLIDRPLLQNSSPEWDWNGLSDWFSKTKLEEVWNLYNQIPSGAAKHVIAKISLLVEVLFVLIEDDLLDPESDMDCTGADIALTILNGAGHQDPSFRLSLSAFPVEIRKFLKDILAEFDFIENAPGVWHFNFSPAALDHFSSGN